jgi:hypothetical protein
MIREAVEEFGPVAGLEGEKATQLRGPGLDLETKAILDALRRIRVELDRLRLVGDAGDLLDATIQAMR